MASDQIECVRPRLGSGEREVALSIDRSSEQITFHRCFKRRSRSFFSWRCEQTFSCSFKDVLHAELTGYGPPNWFLLIITNQGQARINTESSNVREALKILQEAAEDTPAAPFFERNIRLASLLGLIGVIFTGLFVTAVAYWLTN